MTEPQPPPERDSDDEVSLAAMRAAIKAWRCGAPVLVIDRHVEDAITQLRRAKARVLLDAEPADPSHGARPRRKQRVPIGTC